ncbi:CotH kinase family protein [Intrasporangium sp. YIM S08009]|uniref:CotH kinase family protein n=1 Tax=Intrasporangium zincisolvens TaxID=3080018 RepID=UPI002B0624F6|nr:CotH kinase family protein [Intrasporangium sp. YIM S08009]
MMLRRRGGLVALLALSLLVPASVATAQASATAAGPSPSAVSAAPVPPTNLPLLSVALTDPDPTKNTLAYIHASKDNSVAATVNLVDGSTPGNDIIDAGATIKGRGNYTWTLDKRPYQIKFTTAVGPLGMQSSRTWVLLANHQDPSLLRNKIAYDLADSFGLAYSPESRYVDLSINGEYLGNYLLVEKTEVGTNRVALTSDHGVLLEQDPIHGRAEPHYFLTARTGTLFVLKDATLGVDDVLDPTVAVAYAEIQADVNALETALYAPTPDWQRISSLIDVDSFVKYAFIHEVTENYDFDRSSVYFYKNGPGDKLHAGPVWDMDVAMGNFTPKIWGGDPSSEYVKSTTYLRVKRHNWFETLTRNPQFVALTKQMYASTFRSRIDATLAEIDDLRADIEDSAHLNFQRWDGNLGYTTGSFEQGVRSFKNWMSARAAYLRLAYGPGVPTLTFPAHLAGTGWQPAVSSGMIAGTTGEARRLEAVRFAVSGTTLTGGVQGDGHVQNLGWMGWGAPGGLVGTTGRALRLEAVRLRLTGELASRFDLSYRVHVQNVGWMGWVRNGATAGTTGRALRIEAIQVRLLAKAPSTTYAAYVQGLGWMAAVSDGAVSGTTGRALRLEALRMSTARLPFSGQVQYRADVEGLGWMAWTTTPAMIGTVGESRRMEALQVRLIGDLATFYSVRYSAHVQDVGWQPWVVDGATAGTVGQDRRLEAVKIQLVPRVF